MNTNEQESSSSRKQRPKRRIAVIGGGASGMFAAAAAAEAIQRAAKTKSASDYEVIVFEGTKQIMTKVSISGGGRVSY